MKKLLHMLFVCFLLAGLSSTPTRAQETPHTGPSITLNNVYQTLGPCVGLPRVSGPIFDVCGRTLIIKAGGTP